jgi:RNA polymerase sigma-70 factor (ECF subfamily)
MTDSDDLALVLKAASGDNAALGALVECNSATLWRFAYGRLRSEDAADDAVQATWARALPKLKTFQGRAQFSTWLCAICSRVCVDQHRVAQRHGKVLHLSELIARRSTSGDFDDRIVLVAAVKDLPKKLRTAYELVEIGGIPAVDAARILGLPPTTVRTQVARAKERLLELLADAYPDRGENDVRS